MAEFDKKAWHDYLIKLNDREISKRRSSGITLWALFGLIAYLVINITKYWYNNFDNLPYLNLLFFHFVNIFNLCFFTRSTYNCFKRQLFPDERIIFQSDVEASFIVIKTIKDFFYYSIGLIINILIAFKIVSLNVYTWGHWLFSLLYLTYIIYRFSDCKEAIIRYKKRSSITRIPPDLKKSTGKSTIFFTNIFIIIIFAISFYLFIDSLYFGFTQVSKENLIIIKYSFELMITILSCEITCKIIYKIYRNTVLESLELEIIRDNLEIPDIRREFNKKIFGNSNLESFKDINDTINSCINVYNREIKQYFNKIIPLNSGKALNIEEIEFFKDNNTKNAKDALDLCNIYLDWVSTYRNGLYQHIEDIKETKFENDIEDLSGYLASWNEIISNIENYKFELSFIISSNSKSLSDLSENL